MHVWIDDEIVRITEIHFNFSKNYTLKLQQNHNVAKITAYSNMHHIIFICFLFSNISCTNIWKQEAKWK